MRTRTMLCAARVARGMSTFEVRDRAWLERVHTSFGSQTFMSHLGARLVHVTPGEVCIECEASPALRQQNGYFHAGVTTSIADSAAGYAALTLFPAGAEVLTTELKINLLRPAQGDRLVARGRVVKPGKALTVCQADVYGVTAQRDGEDGAAGTGAGAGTAGGGEVHVATLLLTMMQMHTSDVDAG